MAPRISLTGIPLDANSSFVRGAAAAPVVAVDALHSESANLWTETGFDLAGVLDDKGPLPVDNSNEALDAIEKAALEAGRSEQKPIFLGGDHSVTYPLVKGLKQAVGDFAILHFDAHPDCYDIFDGNKLSHACPFSRIMEEGLCSRLVSVGIRTATGHQREQREKLGIEWLEMKDRREWQTLSFDTPVYVTLDMDVFDPGCAPGVAHHEPGGLSAREVIDIIHAIDAPVIGADVVELNPDRDVQGITAMLAAKLIKEIAGMMLR